MPAPAPRVLVRVTATVPRVGLALQLGDRPGAGGLGRIRVVLSDVAFSLAEDQQVCLPMPWPVPCDTHSQRSTR